MHCDNPFSLEGKKILITGASSGIGKASSVFCANLGARIILVGRNIERLQETYNTLSGDGHLVIPTELTNPVSIDNLFDKLDTIDGALMCAGKGETLPVQFCSRDHFDDIFNINFFSTAELVRLLYKKKKITKAGSIVVIASMGGTHVFSGGNSIYGSSKAALNSFMKFAAKEFAARKIRVNCICPAIIDTPFIRRGTVTDEQLDENVKRYPLKRYGRPEDVAAAAAFLLSDASSWITGTSMIVDGGLSLS